MSITAERTDFPVMNVDAVITTDELAERPSRTPDYAAESQALLSLAKTMTKEPRDVLQQLVDLARKLCRAGSAGVSLLDPVAVGSPAQFRWVATAGGYAHLTGNTLPRHFSPCGTVLDQNRLLLMTDPIRYFPYIDVLPEPVREVLLVPFYRADEPIGTVWVALHDDRHFEQEDARLVTSLSQFAAAAVQVLHTAEANRKLEENARLAAEHEARRLTQENERIAALIAERELAETATQRELQDTRLVRDIAARSVAAGDTTELFEAILDAAIVITEADAGTIQLYEAGTRSLGFLATRGFGADILNHFAVVDATSGSPCGVALATGARSRVIFDDATAADPDGSNRWHIEAGMRCAQSTPLISRTGQPLGMFSTHWRTHRELTERELRFLDLLGRQAADLIERAKVLGALQTNERELREADRRKDEFLAVLAHELRNPLVPIRNGIELLGRVREHPLIDKVRPMMERQILHAVRLIDDLLDVSRISSGKIELRRKLVTVAELVESAVETNRNAMDQAGIEWHVTLEDPDRVLEVDAIRLAQVISNVLHNATKFTPRGGRITLQTEFAGEDASQPRLLVRIKDTGVGIAQESLPKLFGLFAQVHAESSVRYGGLGIGLALARKLIELHGGSISADSAGAGQGSEFVISIPAPITSTSKTMQIPITLQDAVGVRVLVVDDNQDAADSAGMLLAEFGGNVRVAYTGAQALQLVKEFDPAVVLLDIGMPDLDGYQACRQIRAEKGSSVVIVAVTGWGQESDRRRAAEAGFDTHLTKPVDSAALESIMTAAKASTRCNPD